MKRGFTILELLVASLLLGMLMSILTMIFNQSSIAWRTGLAGAADLSDTRQSVSDFRYDADNAYPDMNGALKYVHCVFKDDGTIRSERLVEGSLRKINVTIPSTGAKASDSFKTSISCANGTYDNSSNPRNTYVVNVMSAGPDRQMDTYDDIWSFPDDPNEW